MDLTLGSRRAFAAQVNPPSLGADLGRLLDHGDVAPTFLGTTRPFQHPSCHGTPTHVLKIGDVLEDRYEVEEFIGHGGMGEVYRAFDRLIRQQVAIKTLRSELASDPVLAARLRREVQLAWRVTHTNICRLYDIGHFKRNDDGEVVFLSMELLRGETLSEFLRDRPVPIELATEIASQITAGLAAAHSAGIIHRDFKSANIFVTRDPGGSTRAVISDFGVAQEATPVFGENATAFGLSAIVGTPAYMAPEQLEGKPVTTAADIYSLGIVLFEMVSRRLPIEEASPVGIALRRIREPAPDVRDLAPDVPRRWAMTIAACLERDPSKRPQSAESVREMLLGEVNPPRPRLSRRDILITAASGLGTAAACLAIAFRTNSRPISPEARTHYELGLEFAKRRTEENLSQAVAEYEKAVKIEPDYAAAWAGLADAYSAMANYSFTDPKQGLEKARHAADQALLLDPRSGLAMGAKAYVTSLDFRSWQKAEPYFRNAVQLTPHQSLIRLWFGAWLGKRGRFDEAIAQLDAGLAQDPASFALHHQKAIELMLARRFSEMLAEAREVVRLQPYEGEAHIILARALEWSGLYEDALACCAKAENLGNSAVAMCSRGCIEAAAGRFRQANELADKIYDFWTKNPFETLQLAQLFSGVRGLREVLGVLSVGYDRADSTILGVPTSPYFDKWRREPDFKAFLRKLG